MGMSALEVRRRVMLAQPHEAVASGAVASFRTDVLSPLKMSFDLLPIQDLHGQANPYPPGGGKNKLDIDALITAPSGELDGYTFKHKLTLTLLPNTRYTLSTSYDGTGNVLYFNGVTASGNTVKANTPRTFQSSETGELVILLYNRDGISQFENKTVTVQLEEGASATAYAPYSNICPITGHDGFTRTGTGKNLLEVTADNLNKPSYYSGTWSGTSVASGENAITVTMGNGQGGFGGIVLPEGLPAGEYYLSCDVNAEGTKYFYYGYQRMDGTYSGQKSLATSGRTTTHPNHAFTLEEPVKSIFFKMSVANDLTPCTFSNLMVRESDSGTDFEAPSIQSYETEFPTPPGTVYGGHIKDNGDGTYDLTVTKAGRWLSTLTWANNASYARVFNGSGFTNRKIQIDGTDGVALCDTYKFYTSYDVMDYDYGIALANTATGASRFNIYVKNKDCADKDAFVALLQEHDVFVVCPLQTPVQYTGLTLTALQSLIGQNHIWVDNADSVTVEYWGH